MMATYQNGSQSLMTDEKRRQQTCGGQSTDSTASGDSEFKESSSGNKKSYPVSPAPFQSMEACFSAFDSDGDGCLSRAEFEILCRGLFRNEFDDPYILEDKVLTKMFNTFDRNQDALIDRNEFEMCWNRWIKKIIRPVNALIVVDVQNDFITGSLAISNCPAKHNGEEVVEPINRLLDSVEFDCVFYTLDWHPENHVSFVDNIMLRKLHETSTIKNPEDAKLYDTVVFQGPPVMTQKLWPRHCVQNSWGAKLHENLKVVEGSPFIYKGTNPEVDSYSAFFDNYKLSKTALISELQKAGVTDVYICGIAYDVCVSATAFHALELGFRTVVVDDACRGISLDDIQSVRDTLEEQHSIIIHSNQVAPITKAIDRRPELGLKLAVDIQKELNNS